MNLLFIDGVGFWQTLKDFNNIKLLDSIGYKADNRIFKVGIAVVLYILVLAANEIDWGQGVYFECKAESITACDNPFYYENYGKLGVDWQKECPDPELCAIETFYPGQSWGKRPGFFYNNAGFLCVLVISLCVVLNHFLHNRGFSSGFRLE